MDNKPRKLRDTRCESCSSCHNEMVDTIEQLQYHKKELEVKVLAYKRLSEQYKREAYLLAAHIERLNSIPPLDWRQWGNAARDILNQNPTISLAEHDDMVARKAIEEAKINQITKWINVGDKLPELKNGNSDWVLVRNNKNTIPMVARLSHWSGMEEPEWQMNGGGTYIVDEWQMIPKG